MSKPYDLVVFDWEGTISDTLGQVLQTVATEAKILGFGEIDLYKARKYVVLGLVQSLRKLFPHLSDTEHEQLLQAVHHAMFTRLVDISLIPGAREFIKQLQNEKINIAVATNKGHHSLQRALAATGLDASFKVTRSAGQAPAKPCPQMLEEIMAEFGVNPPETLMIGDSVSDMEMAKSINVDCVGVDFYHQQGDALKAAGAIVVFDDYQLLANYLGLPNV